MADDLFVRGAPIAASRPASGNGKRDSGVSAGAGANRRRYRVACYEFVGSLSNPTARSAALRVKIQRASPDRGGLCPK